MHAAEQIAAALSCMMDGGDFVRFRQSIEHQAPRQRVRRAAEGVELLSLRQVDALLGKRRGTATALIESGKLTAAQVGSRLRVARAELDRLLAAGGPLAIPDPIRYPRRRSAAAVGAQRAAAIRALRVVRRSGST
jgi:excisionase family DNA binding protein